MGNYKNQRYTPAHCARKTTILPSGISRSDESTYDPVSENKRLLVERKKQLIGQETPEDPCIQGLLLLHALHQHSLFLKQQQAL
jgi:hypothetical protein